MITVTGLLLVIRSMILVAVLGNSEKKNTVTPAWVKLVFIGWIFSGISMTGQLMARHYAKASPYAYLMALYAVSLWRG